MISQFLQDIMKKKKNKKDEDKTKEELIREIKALQKLVRNNPLARENLESQEALRESENKFRELVEKSLAGVYLIQDGIFKYVNARNAELHGYTVEEIIDKKGPRDLIYPDDWPLVDENIRRRVHGEVESIHYEFRGFTKDERIINVEVYGSRTTYEGRPALIGTLLDITDKKKSEDELRLLNEFNKAIINNAPDAIFTLDKHGVFTSVNPALALISGLGTEAEKKLIGFNWIKNQYTIRNGLAGYIQKGLNGKPFQLWDFPFLTYKGDRSHYMDFKGVPLKGKDGNVEGLLCIIEETTERVKTRAKLVQEAKLSAIGRLAAGVAHELNNPLATMVAHTELASDSLESLQANPEDKTNLEELTSCLQVIQTQAFRCKNVINDILKLTRKDGLEITDIDINVLLDSVLEAANLNYSGVALQRKDMSPLPLARGDFNALRQVFVNLISNAMDAVEGSTDACIWITTGLTSQGLVVEISDNGVGIPDSIIDKIFEPFFTTKESKKGIGLGLSLCYELLKDLKGTIKVESKPGHGTSFFVTLPTASLIKGGIDTK